MGQNNHRENQRFKIYTKRMTHNEIEITDLILRVPSLSQNMNKDSLSTTAGKIYSVSLSA